MSLFPLSKRVADLEPSATFVMNGKVKKLEAEGKKVISFCIGEPDFRTPLHICEAAKQAIDEGMHGYTQTAGTPKLRQAIARALSAKTGVPYGPEQVVASPGGKYSLYLSLMVLLNPGDEVLLPAPYWLSYPELVRLAGGVPVIVPTREEDGFSVTPAALEQAVTPRTKLVILNSPSNPTGQVIARGKMLELGHFLERKNLWCISDELYDQLIFGDSVHTSIASVSAYCRDHTIVVNGCSKTYAMTGWRLGYAGANEDIAKHIDNLQCQTCSNVSTVAQAAAIAALDGDQECVEEMRRQFQVRRTLIHQLLNSIPGMTCAMPQGTFYAFPNIDGLLGTTVAGKKIASPADLCDVAIDKAHVAMVGGEPFGSDRHVRLSFATSEENIVEGCRRVKNLVEGKISLRLVKDRDP